MRAPSNMQMRADRPPHSPQDRCPAVPASGGCTLVAVRPAAAPGQAARAGRILRRMADQPCSLPVLRQPPRQRACRMSRTPQAGAVRDGPASRQAPHGLAGGPRTPQAGAVRGRRVRSAPGPGGMARMADPRPECGTAPLPARGRDQDLGGAARCAIRPAGRAEPRGRSIRAAGRSRSQPILTMTNKKRIWQSYPSRSTTRF